MFEDAMAIVHRFGNPTLFITMTCNPNWEDIQEAIRFENSKGKTVQQEAHFRPDIIARAFHIRVKKLISRLVDDEIFGKVLAYIAVIEHQKRGLPHLHLILTLTRDDRRRILDNVDDIISAELPDPINEKKLYEIISKNMVHGPCGKDNPNCYCMVDGKCRFGFPKK